MQNQKWMRILKEEKFKRLCVKAVCSISKSAVRGRVSISEIKVVATPTEEVW